MGKSVKVEAEVEGQEKVKVEAKVKNKEFSGSTLSTLTLALT